MQSGSIEHRAALSTTLRLAQKLDWPTQDGPSLGQRVGGRVALNTVGICIGAVNGLMRRSSDAPQCRYELRSNQWCYIGESIYKAPPFPSVSLDWKFAATAFFGSVLLFIPAIQQLRRDYALLAEVRQGREELQAASIPVRTEGWLFFRSTKESYEEREKQLKRQMRQEELFAVASVALTTALLLGLTARLSGNGSYGWMAFVAGSFAPISLIAMLRRDLEENCDRHLFQVGEDSSHKSRNEAAYRREFQPRFSDKNEVEWLSRFGYFAAFLRSLSNPSRSSSNEQPFRLDPRIPLTTEMNRHSDYKIPEWNQESKNPTPYLARR